jgi:penicillin-binding protein 2
MGQVWHQGETLITGIGQGYVLSTPLQLAVMTARLVNGGKAVAPRITRDVRGEEREAAPDPVSLGIPEESLAIVLRGMDGVVNGGGTAAGIRIADANMQIGGKTGTSQVRRITEKERAQGVKKNEELPWHQRDHALFVGYGPVHQPRYAVAVLVEHGGGGARVAAPIARDILKLTMERDPARRSHAVAEKA